MTKSRDPNKVDAVKIPNSGTSVGAAFAAWTVVFALADYYRVSERPYVVWVTAAGLIGGAFAAFMFLWLSSIARRHVCQDQRHRAQVEEGGYCPWAYFGGLGIIFAVFLIGLAAEYLAYHFRPGTPFPAWEVVLLGANVAVVGLTWWTHLVIAERQPPEVPPSGPGKEIFLKALEMETQFLRAIVSALTQFVYLIGFALIGTTAFVVSGFLNLGGYIYPILLGLGMWVLGLHLGLTSPFMRRHGEIIRAMVMQARGGDGVATASQIQSKTGT
ncbi:MAG: hypothetical protein HY670_10400 [Chloroflexi bacterium]|nr:hypothetical protein [Chloroflexota bacterium]